MENEHLVKDITSAACDNHQTCKKILRIQNFYDERIMQKIIHKDRSDFLNKTLSNAKDLRVTLP